MEVTGLSFTWSGALHASFSGLLLAMGALRLAVAVGHGSARNRSASSFYQNGPVVYLLEIHDFRAGPSIADHLQVDPIWLPIRANENIAFVRSGGDGSVRQSEDNSVKLRASIFEAGTGGRANAVLRDPFL